MSFKRANDDTVGPCKYTTRYLCSCSRKKSGSAPVIIDIEIVDHKMSGKKSLYLFGAYHEDTATLKFCPVCGTTVPTAEAILALEMLRDHE